MGFGKKIGQAFSFGSKIVNKVAGLGEKIAHGVGKAAEFIDKNGSSALNIAEHIPLVGNFVKAADAPARALLGKAHQISGIANTVGDVMSLAEVATRRRNTIEKGGG